MHTVVKEESVTDFIDREAQNHPRLRDVVRGLEWLLSREPHQEAAEEVPGSIERFGQLMYLIKTEDLCFHEAGPPLRLLYYVEEETVVFWGIGFDGPDQLGSTHPQRPRNISAKTNAPHRNRETRAHPDGVTFSVSISARVFTHYDSTRQ